MKKSKFLYALAVTLLLGGCSGLKSSTPPATLYTLHAAAAPAQVARAPRIVSIAEPAVPPGFESDRIAIYLQQDRRMDYAAGAAWPAPLPKVIQEFLVHSAGTGITAVTPDSGIPAAYSLQVRVNDFEPSYTADAKAAPLLKASMTFTLISLERNKIVARFTESREAPAATNSLTSITGGLEALAQSMATEAFGKMQAGSGRKAAPRTPGGRHLTPGANISSTDIWQ